MNTKSIIALFVAITLIIIAVPTTVYAQNGYAAAGSEASEARQLRYNLRMDLVVTGILAAGFLGTSALQKHLAPENCHWCGVNAFDDWGHRNLAWSNTGAANTTSSITAFALAPMAAFGIDALAAHHDGRLGEFPVDALVIAESASAAAMFTQIVKFTAGRQRPYAHYRAASGVASPSSDDNTSFFSNHTSIAFSLAVSSGTVATMRGYRLAPLIWGVGLATAATTGYLRVAADKHYLTDVIAGAVIGSAFGFGIPYLFHRPRTSNPHNAMISAVPVSGGGILMVRGTL